MPIPVWEITYTTILLLISSFPFLHFSFIQRTQLVWLVHDCPESLCDVTPCLHVWPEQHQKIARLTTSWWFRPYFSRQKGRIPRFWLQDRLDQPGKAKMRDNHETHLHIPWLRDHVACQWESSLWPLHIRLRRRARSKQILILKDPPFQAQGLSQQVENLAEMPEYLHEQEVLGKD